MKLLGQRLSARDFDRQVAELQVRIVVLNGYTRSAYPSQRRGISPSGERGTPTYTRFGNKARRTT